MLFKSLTADRFFKTLVLSQQVMNWCRDALDSPGAFVMAAAASGKASVAGCVPFGEGGDVRRDGAVFSHEPPSCLCALGLASPKCALEWAEAVTAQCGDWEPLVMAGLWKMLPYPCSCFPVALNIFRGWRPCRVHGHQVCIWQLWGTSYTNVICLGFCLVSSQNYL